MDAGVAPHVAPNELLVDAAFGVGCMDTQTYLSAFFLPILADDDGCRASNANVAKVSFIGAIRTR